MDEKFFNLVLRSLMADYLKLYLVVGVLEGKEKEIFKELNKIRRKNLLRLKHLILFDKCFKPKNILPYYPAFRREVLGCVEALAIVRDVKKMKIVRGGNNERKSR